MSSWKDSLPRVRTTPDRSSTSNLPPAGSKKENPPDKGRSRNLPNFKINDEFRMSSLLTSIPDEKVVKVGIGVGVLGLQGEDWGVGWGVQLNHSLKKLRCSLE